MSDFSLIGGGSEYLSGGYDLANTVGTSVTSSATANTQGAWVELVSAANNTMQSDSLSVYMGSDGGIAQLNFLVNIGIGTTETVICPDLYAQTASDSSGMKVFRYDFPLGIPAGQKISAQCSSNGSSGLIKVWIVRGYHALSQDSPLGIVTAYGANTGASSGTIVARSTANTFGSWVQLSASTAEEMRGFVVAAIRAQASWTTGQRIVYQVGIGSAGNEEVIFSGQEIATNAQEVGNGHISPFVAVQIASGQRVAIRAQSNAANADGDLDYVIYGVR